MRDVFDDFLDDNASLDAGTLKEYSSKINNFLGWCDTKNIQYFKELKADVLSLFFKEWGQRKSNRGGLVSPATLEGYARTIRLFFRWVLDQDVYETGDLYRLKPKAPRAETKPVEVYSDDEVKRLLRVVGVDQINAEMVHRDTAIVLLLLDTGIRASELLGLRKEDLFLALSQPYIVVQGKRKKVRSVPIGKDTIVKLNRYLKYRSEGDLVFVSRSGDPLTVDGLNQVIGRLCKKAGIKNKREKVHAFRHTFAVNYLLNGGELYTLSLILGHEDTRVTIKHYLRMVKSSDMLGRGISHVDKMMKKK